MPQQWTYHGLVDDDGGLDVLGGLTDVTPVPRSVTGQLDVFRPPRAHAPLHVRRVGTALVQLRPRLEYHVRMFLLTKATH